MSSEKKIDVTALGELLIDFVQNGISDQGNNLFEANPGGAPCNVLAMLNKAGKETAFIGKKRPLSSARSAMICSAGSLKPRLRSRAST